MPVDTIIRLRRGTAAAWTLADPILALGEMGIETDTRQFKFGDGSTAWTGLSYGATPAGAGAVTTTGSPTTGVLTMFSGATSITDADAAAVSSALDLLGT